MWEKKKQTLKTKRNLFIIMKWKVYVVFTKKAFFLLPRIFKSTDETVKLNHVWSEKVEMNIKNLHLPSKLYYRYQLIWEGGTDNLWKKIRIRLK